MKELKMNSMPFPRDKNLWRYTILPPLVIDIGGLIIFGGYYRLK